MPKMMTGIVLPACSHGKSGECSPDLHMKNPELAHEKPACCIATGGVFECRFEDAFDGVNAGVGALLVRDVEDDA